MSQTSSFAGPPVVIAHRAASGYLPEHTLEAVTLAHAMEADFIEQDCVLTKDGIPIVLHDIHLDTVTDVASRFGGRQRPDGRYYALDFTLAEIKQLNVHERVDHKTGQAVFPQRFPIDRGQFRVPTLQEEIDLIQGLNRTRQHQAGIYVELKGPQWHHQHGQDVATAVLQVLDQNGYREHTSAAYIQCFDPAELRRVRTELHCRLRLIQLLEGGADRHAELKTAEGLAAIAEYAEGIGPEFGDLLLGVDDHGRPLLSPLVRLAHEAGLLVHTYTLRADQLPAYATTFDQLQQWILIDAQVDGAFTDFPDRVPRRPPSTVGR